MDQSQLNKIKNGKIVVNICILAAILDKVFSFLEKKSTGNKDLIFLDIIVSCIYLGIILFYYIGNKNAFNLITSIAPFLLALLPFGIMIPIMNLFNMRIYNKLGELGYIVFYVIGLIIIYILFKRFELFSCIKEYKNSRTNKQNY